MRNLLSALSSVVAASMSMAIASHAATPDWTRVGEAVGKPGEMYADEVYKVTLPRNDLTLSLDGVSIRASFLRGSWVSFHAMGDQTVAVADLALTEAEVKPVMEKLELSGWEITGLHNHMTRIRPMMLFLHAMAHGDAVQLGRDIHEALLRSKTPFTTAEAPPWPRDISASTLDEILGASSKREGGVLKYRIPRADVIRENGMPIPAAMGSETGVNIQPSGPGRVAITGDVTLIESEVQPVVNALRENGIEVMALHNHMLAEEPRLFFLHFWVDGDPVKSARGTRRALDKVNLARPK